MLDNNEQIKQQIQGLINDYALKLAAVERDLTEKQEELRILRKSYQLLEERLTPSEKHSQELNSKCRSLEQQIRDLEEQNGDLRQSGSEQIGQIAKLKHRNKNQLITVIILIILLILSGVALFANTGGAKSLQKSFTSGDRGSSTARKTGKKKRARRSASENNAAHDETAAAIKDSNAAPDMSANTVPDKSATQDNTNDNN